MLRKRIFQSLEEIFKLLGFFLSFSYLLFLSLFVKITFLHLA